MKYVELFLFLISVTFASAFDFFEAFRGGHQRRGMPTSFCLSNFVEEGAEAGGRCPEYLCDFRVGPCVSNPAECPCREGTYKCVHGPDKAFSCVASRKVCEILSQNS
jgi:hypothetical protein